jgi:hypothetical protein
MIFRGSRLRSNRMKRFSAIRWVLHLLLLPRSQLVLENLALRQQLAVLIRQRPRPTLQRRDQLFWVCLSRLWSGWRSVLVVVQPDTVVRWHQQGFRLWWRWKSRTKRAGRPPLDKEVRVLIGQMARDNSTWGAPRIQAELRLLGHEVAEATVAKYMKRSRPSKPPSQTWKVFLKNHVGTLASMDFFVVPTVTLPAALRLRHSQPRPSPDHPFQRNDVTHGSVGWPPIARSFSLRDGTTLSDSRP